VTKFSRRIFKTAFAKFSLASPQRAGYEFPRREQLFWQMIHPGTRHNYFLRLFNRKRGTMNDVPIHSAFSVDGSVERVEAPLFHFS
jgi:hypothetical protein